MKKVYEKPIAYEEEFQANSYVAKCQIPITTVVTGEPMRCINPKHSWPGNYGDIFGYIWVDGDKTTCTVKVDLVNDPQSVVENEDNYKPAMGTYVYGLDDKYYTDSTAYYYVSRRNVPSIVNSASNGGPCYGTYLKTGKIEEHLSNEQVFS